MSDEQASAMRSVAECVKREIDKRDDAEQCLSGMYYLVTGNSPKWSDSFGLPEAVQDVADAMELLRKTIAGPPSTRAAYKCLAVSKAACAWPDCGCDPYAIEVVQALVDQGWIAPPECTSSLPSTSGKTPS